MFAFVFWWLEIPLCLLPHAAGIPYAAVPSPVLLVLLQVAAVSIGENTPDFSESLTCLFTVLFLLSFLFSL